ncbi:MAG: nucleotidyltransferase domain-containing protein [Cyanobacteriota bacterium]
MTGGGRLRVSWPPIGSEHGRKREHVCPTAPPGAGAADRGPAPAPERHPGANRCGVWLFGSLARGDWDGFSDTDLLVVAANQHEAERAADQLDKALVGEDVLAIDQARWEAMDHSPSPHWRAIRAQAIRLHPQP